MRHADGKKNRVEAKLASTAIMTLYDQTAGDESRFIPQMAQYYIEHQKLDTEPAYREAKWDFRIRDIIERMSPCQLEKLKQDLPDIIERAKKRPALKLIKGGRCKANRHS
ncbi:MAG: hypothetical protein ACREQW_03800 [Candidatus Binatia bacterium]